MTDEFNKRPTIAELMALERQQAAVSATPSAPAKKPYKSFFTRQFTVFAMPYLQLYLQGAIKQLCPSLELTDSELIARALANSTDRLTLSKLPDGPTTALLKGIVAEKARLYVDKDWHRTILTEAMQQGLDLVKDLVVNRVATLERIAEYRLALKEQLTKDGCDTVEGWQLTVGSSTGKARLSADDLQEAINNL